jgi:hypothetical protein
MDRDDVVPTLAITIVGPALPGGVTGELVKVTVPAADAVYATTVPAINVTTLLILGGVSLV